MENVISLKSKKEEKDKKEAEERIQNLKADEGYITAVLAKNQALKAKLERERKNDNTKLIRSLGIKTF